MINLGDKVNHTIPHHERNLVVRIKKNDSLPSAGKHAILVDAIPDEISKRAEFYCTSNMETFDSLRGNNVPAVLLPPSLSHVDSGDIVRVSSNDHYLRILFKKKHRQNAFLLTERCNNWCIMCSQPPKDIDDSYLVDDVLAAISLLDESTPEIAFTGGEPSLLGDKLITLISAAKNLLPRTALHILSNGRNFSDETLARKVGDVKHPDLMLGIPLYADNAGDHNYVVQADAFEETIAGIMNLKRHGVKVEIRCVLHAATYERLPELAKYISRNLLFVDQVVLMGLEAMGFGKTNFNSLWVDPGLLVPKIEEAIGNLNRAKIRCSLYNLPLCILGNLSQQHAVKSISDWKNEYLDGCHICTKKNECCGFFSSTKHHYVNMIKPFK